MTVYRLNLGVVKGLEKVSHFSLQVLSRLKLNENQRRIESLSVIQVNN